MRPNRKSGPLDTHCKEDLRNMKRSFSMFSGELLGSSRRVKSSPSGSCNFTSFGIETSKAENKEEHFVLTEILIEIPESNSLFSIINYMHFDQILGIYFIQRN